MKFQPRVVKTIQQEDTEFIVTQIAENLYILHYGDANYCGHITHKTEGEEDFTAWGNWSGKSVERRTFEEALEALFKMHELEWSYHR